MKNLILLVLVIVLIFSCKDFAKKPDRGKSIPPSSKLFQLKHHAESVKTALLDSCKHLNNLQLPSQVEITPKMYQLINYSEYKNTCTLLNDNVGKTTSARLMDSFFSRDGLLVIYRYQFKGEKSEEAYELRIVFTFEQKLTEFQFFKWQDKYHEDLIIMNWF